MSFRVFSRKFSAGRQLRAIMDEQFTPDKLKSFEKPGKIRTLIPDKTYRQMRALVSNIYVADYFAEVVQGVELWRKVTYYVALPCCLFASVYCINGHLEHEKHTKRPEFIPYEHLRIRTRVCATI